MCLNTYLPTLINATNNQRWRSTGQDVWTFAIVTTASAKEHWLKDRRPVLLMDRDAIDKWLDTSSQDWSEELNTMVTTDQDTTPLILCVNSFEFSILVYTNLAKNITGTKFLQKSET